MINTIAHFADIHIHKSLDRHEEYRKILKQVYTELKEQKPDRIVIVGDTYNDYIDIEGEAIILIGEMLNNFSKIAPVIITRGNHEIRKKNRSRVDTVRTITDLLENSKITYYNKSGFYQDDNIVWVVWDHVEHRYDNINPWINISHKIDKNLTYIDLYHDPIDGCKFYTGYNPGNRNFPTPKDFKGDYSLFGDIHLRQFFSKKTKAFAGSLVQQSFGEEPFDHGYLLWDIKKGNVQEINIENEYKLIKFEINPNTNYDKLNLTSKYIGKYNKFKIDWNEHAAFVTNENENKIRKYLKDKYSADDIEIKPNRIYTDIKDGKMLSEIIDINDKEVQQDIIKKYLKENKFENEFIEQIINIDDIINDRLKLSNTKNVIWNIDKFWFNNFKSYGDDNIIEWDNINGIIQIGGINQQGKSTIIDAISFILYGTTVSTTKSEKNGNNRYINKNRDLNYCEGGAVLNINGEKYIMYRKVEREYNKGKIIKSVPMTLDYYKGTEMLDESKLTGERKTSTQKLLDEVLGNFDDFIRLSLTNADNLNSLLSMDRSIFIDSIIKDAGYDIFDKKLIEFKEYKKELNFEKININRTELQNEIKKIDDNLKIKEESLFHITKDIIDVENNLKENIDIKDKLLTRLNNIDENLLNIDLDEIKKEILISEKERNRIKIEIENLQKDIIRLPEEFNNENFDNLNEQYNKYLNEKNKRDIEIVQLNNLYVQNEDKINNVDKDIRIEKNKYLDYLRNNVAGLRVELREFINEINNNANIKRNSFESKKNNIKLELSNLKQNGLDEKKKISDYKNMLDGENQICVTCNQPITNKDEVHMNSLITESFKKIENITNVAKQKFELLNEYNSKLESLTSVTDTLIEEKKLEYDIKIKEIQNKIDNFDVAYIQDRIENILKNKEYAESENFSLNEKLSERKTYINKLDFEIKKLELNIQKQKIEKSLHDRYKTLTHDKDILSSTLRDIERTFEDNTKSLKEYNKNRLLIEENDQINIELKDVKDKIDLMSSKRVKCIDDKLSYSNDIILSKKVIGDLKDKLSRYIDQEKREELHNVYLKLMHRTGLPTYLLTKNIDILNKELSDLLTNINFILFFDEDLNLKLQHDGLDGVINVIEASGAERVFSSIVLKMVLRVINFKSKPNILFLDEVLNKCVGKTVDKFMELLDTLKSKIDKIIIIEHNNEIVSDLFIDVKKDENGISSFELI